MKRTIWILMVLSALAFQMACDPKTASTPTPTPTPAPTPDPVGTVNDSAGFYVKVYQSDDANYRLHKDLVATSTTDCTIKAADATKDISCVVDIPEEDLFYTGLKFQYNVPSDMCTYVHVSSYYYENFEIGGVGIASPRAVASAISVYIKDDVVGFDHNGGNTAPNPAAPAPTGIAGIDAEGAPVCAFDYSSTDGAPNCCTGITHVTTYKRKVDDSGWDVTREDKDWGGKPGTCLDGAALETQPLDKDGFPRTEITFVENTGLNKTMAPTAPIKHFGGVFSNLNLANFHQTIPVGTNGLDGKYSNQPYEWRCMDRAGDVKARIRLYVREWNEFTEWQAKGNPDTGPAFEAGPFADNQVNDFSDWADIFANFGGFLGFVK